MNNLQEHLMKNLLGAARLDHTRTKVPKFCIQKLCQQQLPSNCPVPVKVFLALLAWKTIEIFLLAP
jgi:hypothetical protein